MLQTTKNYQKNANVAKMLMKSRKQKSKESQEAQIIAQLESFKYLSHYK